MTAVNGGWRVDFPHHGPEQLFAVAADVEAYPRFLPWCRLTRIRKRDANRLEVENLFGIGPMQLRFRSQAQLDPPHGLDITAQDGPFRQFHLSWRFIPLDQGGCRVVAEYRMELRSPLLHSLTRLTLPDMERRVVQRFKERVRTVTGS